MDLNYLLSQEQLAMMQADAALNSADFGTYDRVLRQLRPLIEATGFPHRPYRGAFRPGNGLQSWLGAGGRDR